VVAFLAVAACGEPTGPMTPAAAYTLSTIDAKVLPATLYADTGYSLIATAGTLTLTEDLKYTWTLTTRETVDGNASTYIENDSGTWIQTAAGGVGITMTSAYGGVLTATWSGTTLTLNLPDGVFLYSR
jgi:hypothetical protein